MTTYLLDTSFIIDFLKDKNNSRELFHLMNGVFTSSYICFAELYDGVNRSSNKVEQEELISDFFGNLSAIFSVGEQVAKQFGQTRADLKKKGRLVGDMDLLIAATCIVHDAVLVTQNVKHFERIEGLQLYKFNNKQ